MPFRIHNAYHAWISHVLGYLVHLGDINPEEHFALTTEGYASQYSCVPFNLLFYTTQRMITSQELKAGSVKMPDYSLRPRFIKYPSIFLEFGWSESFPRLRIDRNLWIDNSDGHIQLLFLIKWNKLKGGRVSGVIEVWAGDATANDRRHPQGAVEDRDLWLMSRCQRRDGLNCPKRPLEKLLYKSKKNFLRCRKRINGIRMGGFKLG